MKVVLKYLKPFVFGLVMAFALLFMQAMCDLNLPNYMSEIVNVGIQQNGIEHAAPDAISADGMKFIKTFMSGEDKALAEKSYRLVNPSDKDDNGNPYSEKYSGAADQFYVKNDISEEDSNALDNAFGKSTLTFYNFIKSQASQEESEASQTDSSGLSDINVADLYSMQSMLDMLPSSAFDAAREQAVSNDESIMRQSGIMLTKAFYSELGVDIGGIQTRYIVIIGAKMIGIALLGGLATVLVSLLSSRIAAGVARNMRESVFCKIESFSNTEFDKFSTASLITRSTNDIMQIQMMLQMGIRMICYAPILGIGGIIMAVEKSASMSWIIAAACVVLLGLIMVIMAIAMPRFKILQKLIDRLNLVSREGLSGLMVIRAFGTQKHESKRFDEANTDLTKTNLFINRVMAVMMPAMTVIMNAVTLLIVWVGAHQISQSAMQVGDMMAFMQYAMQIIMSFLMISMMFIFVPRALVSAARIGEVLDIDVSIKDPDNPVPYDESKKGFVEFKNVHFRYLNAEEDALSGITFTARPGETTAIIGSTGSGKSTLVNLMLRFYDVTEGEVLVSGVNVKDMQLHDLREHIGYVPQKGVLLSGTIESNMRYGRREADDKELDIAAEVAQASEFISEKPEKFNSEIAQGGTNVSGGQKQRLSIARALVKQPDIFIFDDSFSALDFKTDAALRKRLKEHTGDSTVIVVAQRVSTIMTAEQILVLDEGRIVGKGTHRELLKNCPQYYEIAASQLSKEELQ